MVFVEHGNMMTITVMELKLQLILLLAARYSYSRFQHRGCRVPHFLSGRCENEANFLAKRKSAVLLLLLLLRPSCIIMCSYLYETTLFF